MTKNTIDRYQSATEMLKDMSMALKNPEGEFVQERKIDTNTQNRGVKSLKDTILTYLCGQTLGIPLLFPQKILYSLLLFP